LGLSILFKIFFKRFLVIFFDKINPCRARLPKNQKMRHTVIKIVEDYEKHDRSQNGGDNAMKYLWSFIVGGAICAIAQVLIDRTKLTPARILVSYVVLGVFLGAIGVYAPLVEFAGAGATVPLTGFGYNISKGIRRAVDEKGFLGIFTGALTAASGGTAAALIFGYLVAIIFKARPKR
jgi:stage V sporulation protein AE